MWQASLEKAVAEQRDWRVSANYVRSLSYAALYELRFAASRFYSGYNFDAFTGDLVFFCLKEKKGDNAVSQAPESGNSGGSESAAVPGDRVVED